MYPLGEPCTYKLITVCSNTFLLKFLVFTFPPMNFNRWSSFPIGLVNRQVQQRIKSHQTLLDYINKWEVWTSAGTCCTSSRLLKTHQGAVSLQHAASLTQDYNETSTSDCRCGLPVHETTSNIWPLREASYPLYLSFLWGKNNLSEELCTCVFLISLRSNISKSPACLL